MATKRLDKVIIEDLDFCDCIKKHDSENTFFYCDPPYNKGRGYQFQGINFTPEDHTRLFNALKNIKGKFLLSYEDSESTRERYKGFQIESFVRKKGIKGISGAYFNELLIKNYE